MTNRENTRDAAFLILVFLCLLALLLSCGIRAHAQDFQRVQENGQMQLFPVAPLGPTTVSSLNAIEMVGFTRSLQVAHDHLPSTGGLIIVPDTVGIPAITVQVNITKPNVEIACTGGLLSQVTGAINFPLINVTGNNFKMHGCLLSNTFTSGQTGLIGNANVLRLTTVSNAEIFNNTFTSGLTGVFLLGVTDVTVRNNVFTGLAVTAVDANWDGANPNTRVTVTDNHISGTLDYPAWAALNGSGHDINLEDTPTFTIAHNVVIDNGTLGTTGVASSAIQYGPNHVSTPATGVVVANLIVNSGAPTLNGIGTNGGTSGTVVHKNQSITANIIQGGYQFAILFGNLQSGNLVHIAISGNTLTEFIQNGIVLNGFSAGTVGPQEVVISGNTITGAGNVTNGAACVRLQWANGATISGNSISRCKTNGIELAGASNTNVNANTIFDNSQGAANTNWGINLLPNSSNVNNNNIVDNILFDDQGSPTQTRSINILGTSNRVSGNQSIGAVTNDFVDGGTTTIVQLNSWGIAFAGLAASANGSVTYCSNCTIANPCASGGTGAIAKRLNSVWVCN